MRNALWALSFLLVGAVVGIGCDRDRADPAGSSPTAQPDPTPVANPARDTVLAPGEAPAEAPGEASGDEPGEEAEVKVEEAEASPESPNVRLRLEVHPKTHRSKVYWGRKLLGVAPLDFQRPRRSGPLELVIQAEGYLDYHTRMFTDRDETLVVRMVHLSEQNTLLGFRQTADAGASPTVRSPDAGVAP
jgi:hypothetical protein